MNNSPEYSSPSSLWLPNLVLDWQSRYQSGLAALRQAERDVAELASGYRSIHEDYRAGYLPQPIDVKPDGTSGIDKELQPSVLPWTRLQEVNLGLPEGHSWTDIAPLLPDPEADAEDENLPVACLFAQIDCGTDLALINNQIQQQLDMAERHFTLLLQSQPADALALNWRARTYQLRAKWMRMSMLPLAEQPAVYPKNELYRRAISCALSDLNRAVELLSAPALSMTRQQQTLVRQMLYDCHLRLYQLHWSWKTEEQWQKACEALSSAIAIKPTVELYLARVEIFCRRLPCFDLAAQDCISSLELAAPQIPNRHRTEFDCMLGSLKIAMSIDPGCGAHVIRTTLRFWESNPLLMRAA